MFAWRHCLIACCLLPVTACQTPNYFLLHPDAEPSAVNSRVEEQTAGDLRLHLSWAEPAGAGPFATVIVHPHGGKTIVEMQGVIWDLAQHGFLAVAVDYQRRIDGQWRRTLFAWREPQDALQALLAVRRNPRVDGGRIALLGFSQGAMLSLLIAATAPQQVRAVAAYYPVADFNAWFSRPKRNFIEAWVYTLMRRQFRSESGARSEEEFTEILRRASPLNSLAGISAPVLLVHGEQDQSAPVGESRVLWQRLRELGKEADLLVLPGAVHIFNFRQLAPGRQAWDYTLDWLHRKLAAADAQPPLY